MNLLNYYFCYLISIQIALSIAYNLTPVDSEEAYDDPDAKRDIAELITSRGFDYEVHYVTTQDSYILGVYRIINPFVSENQRKKLRPVVIQHGFLSSGGTFLINSPDGFASPCDPADQLLESANDYNDTHTNNLGFLLANRCYDVWLANSRGNHYSRNHTTLNPDKDPEFWRFSFDEMIKYDTPNLIDYILDLTSFESLGWIGHSQGTLIMFGLLSEQPAYSQKVKPFVALAPVAYVANILKALRFASAIPGALWTLRKVGGELADSSTIVRTTSQFVCGRWQPKSCDNLVYPLEGYTLSMMNQSRVNVFRSQQKIAGSSVWNLVHFGQNVNSRSFAKFDYGTIENKVRYNSPSPPKYTLSQINSTQIAILHGKADRLGDPKDVQTLVDKLKVPLFRDYEIPNPKWDHMDFIYAEDLYETVHTVVLDVLRESQIEIEKQRLGQMAENATKI